MPEDIALVGVDNDDLYCHLARPPLSSVTVNAERVGYESARLLDRLLAGRRCPKTAILVPPVRVHVRRSSELLAIEDADVAKAARFIRENAVRPISVTDVLRQVPLSRRSLERRFKKILGRGVAEEICRVRLERCKHLLVETDLKIATVAHYSGFSSARHLADVFSRELGMSPSEFRKRSRPKYVPRLAEE
ncbi:MAG: helix-turn-helix domain-containing protein [Planctomycetes bacterium]|nr:helix-turn-helix domain-containing protein [Planctomycetota bacterium]